MARFTHNVDCAPVAFHDMSGACQPNPGAGNDADHIGAAFETIIRPAVASRF